jgi:hypothetical protein
MIGTLLVILASKPSIPEWSKDDAMQGFGSAKGSGGVKHCPTKADVRYLTCELVAGPVVVRTSPVIAPYRHGRLVRKSLPSSGLMESSGGAGAHPYSDFVRTHVGEPWNGFGSGNGDGANDSGNGNGTGLGGCGG